MERMTTEMMGYVPNIEQPSKRTTEINRNLRQQNKIISVLMSGDFSLIGKEEVFVSDQEREKFLKSLAQEEISSDDFEELLTKIRPPAYDEEHPKVPNELFSLISGDRQMCGIVAYFVRGDFTQRSILDAGDLGMFLEQFPHSMAIEEKMKSFLNIIERDNGAEKREEYELTFRRFFEIIYGKRYEYWQQMKLLKREALEKFPKNSSNEDFLVENISDPEAQEIMRKVELQGDSFNGKKLTREILIQEGLEPKHKIQVGESIVWFSSSGYKIGEGRVAVVAYVEREGKTFARSYYRSNSQGVWRYLPEYQNSGGKVGWYGKGWSEESITLPVSLQEALAKITENDQSILEVNNPELIFAGTAHQLTREELYLIGIFHSSPDQNDREKAIAELKRISPTSYRDEVGAIPLKLEGKFSNANPRRKISPEELVLSTEEAPDFGKLEASWEQNSSIYGRFVSEVFPSKNGKLKFIFCRDEDSRVWIGGIEAQGELESTGLKREWVDGENLTTPAFEYSDQAGGYGNKDILRGEDLEYVDMFENYLKRIPVIQEYLRHRNFRGRN